MADSIAVRTVLRKLLAARWPDRIREVMPSKFAQLEDPKLVRLYRLGSELLESDAGGDDPRLEEIADIMASLAEQAHASGEINLSARRRTTI